MSIRRGFNHSVCSSGEGAGASRRRVAPIRVVNLGLRELEGVCQSLRWNLLLRVAVLPVRLCQSVQEAVFGVADQGR